MGVLAGRLWVSGTLLLISFISFSSQIWIIWPSYGGKLSRPLLECLVPFNFLLVLLYYNYALCVTTNPGRVPKGWEPDERDGDVEVKKLTGGPRYCRTCRAYKPPRAHHCRKCKTCVLKMDHHCPWVNNCVGHHNYGHFVRFLFMVDIACTYHLWMISERAFGALAFATEPSTTQIVILVLNYTACVPVLMAVGMFSLYHFYCLITNTTTIEGWEKDKVAVLKRKGRIQEYRYPYHLGYFSNIQSVLGYNPLLWCWPRQGVPGTGLHYPVGGGLDAQSQYSWPPEDEQLLEERAIARDYRRRAQEPAAFTYGTGLNPALTSLRSRRGGENMPQRANTTPFHDDYEPPPSSDEDDDVPLQQLAVRVRRGSEGYEVKPRMTYQPVPAEMEYEERGDDAEWEAGRISEGELDDEGDRRRAGPRYRRYEPEPDSDSSADSLDSLSSLDSMDEYLEENTVL